VSGDPRTTDPTQDTATAKRAEAAARALLADLPRLHHWGPEPSVGGLNQAIGERIITELGRYEEPRVVETGAGASTLLFCCLEPKAVTSIAPDAALRDRTLSEAEAREIPTDRLRFLCEQSELALPRLAAAGEGFEVGFIDGSHGMPSVFVDFCFMNLMMPVGGTLFVDDVQLYSVAQLYGLLRQQEEFDYVALDSKMATFRKVLEHAFLPDWRGQPFVEQNTVVDPPSR
jgi:Methyltransferase domain